MSGVIIFTHLLYKDLLKKGGKYVRTNTDANIKTRRSQIEANKRFDAKTYTYRSVKFRNEELEAILEYCKKNNLSINGFMRETLMKAISEDK